MRFFDPKRRFFSLKMPFLKLMPVMEPMENDLAILSIIAHYNDIVNLISAVMCEIPEKPSFLTIFGPKRISFLQKLPFMFLVHLFRANG